MEVNNIFQRMAAITAELGTIAKNLSVETGKGKSYKAVSERDVLDAVKPLEQKYGVYSYPFSRETVESEKLESENTYNGNTTKKTTFYTRLKTVYRFVNIDMPVEFVDITSFSVGMDTQDKGDGKAMTYGDKYALMKAYKISTGDDPDQEASEETSYRNAGKPQRTAEQKQADAEQFIRDEAAKMIHREGDTEYGICDKCGGYIYNVKKKDGSIMSVHEYLIASLKTFGKPLCNNCRKEAMKQP